MTRHSNATPTRHAVPRHRPPVHYAAHAPVRRGPGAGGIAGGRGRRSEAYWTATGEEYSGPARGDCGGEMALGSFAGALFSNYYLVLPGPGAATVATRPPLLTYPGASSLGHYNTHPLRHRVRVRLLGSWRRVAQAASVRAQLAVCESTTAWWLSAPSPSRRRRSIA